MNFPHRNLPSGLLPALALTALVAGIIGCGGGGGGSTTTNTTGGGTNDTGGSGGSGGGTNTGGGDTGGDTGGGTGGGVSVIPGNKIFFQNGTFDSTQVRYVDPDGTGDTLYATLPEAYSGFASNPVANEFAFGHTSTPGNVNAKYGLFRNSTVNIGGAVQLAPRNYTDIMAVQYTPNGQQIVFAATLSEGDDRIYRVNRDGTGLTQIDAGEDLDISPDGTKVVYTRLNGTFGDIYVKNINGTGTATRLTSNSGEDWQPQWSKNGQKIVFSSSRGGGELDIYTMNANGTSQLPLTQTPGAAEFGPSFSPDGSQVSFTVIALDPSQSGLFKINSDGTGRTALKLSPSMMLDTWWSPATTGAMPTRGLGRLSMSKRMARRNLQD